MTDLSLVGAVRVDPCPCGRAAPRLGPPSRPGWPPRPATSPHRRRRPAPWRGMGWLAWPATTLPASRSCPPKARSCTRASRRTRICSGGCAAAAGIRIVTEFEFSLHPADTADLFYRPGRRASGASPMARPDHWRAPWAATGLGRRRRRLAVPAASRGLEDQAQLLCAGHGGFGAVGGAELVHEVADVLLTVSKATTRSAVMAWFDRPAASIRSTSSARQMEVHAQRDRDGTFVPRPPPKIPPRRHVWLTPGTPDLLSVQGAEPHTDRRTRMATLNPGSLETGAARTASSPPAAPTTPRQDHRPKETRIKSLKYRHVVVRRTGGLR